MPGKLSVPKVLVIAGACVLVGLAMLALWLDREVTNDLSSENKPAGHSPAMPSPGALYSAQFVDLQGNTQSLSQWDRKLLVVNFWATWCGPCKEEIPILVKLQQKFGDENLRIVGIAADSSANVAKFAESVHINYPILVDEMGAVAFSKRLGNRLGLLPHTIVFKAGGEVVYAKLGAVTEGDMNDIIGKNIAKTR